MERVFEVRRLEGTTGEFQGGRRQQLKLQRRSTSRNVFQDSIEDLDQVEEGLF